MTKKQEQDRIDALMGMPEMSVRVLWGRVVERGRGLNYRVHGTHDRYQGVLEAALSLV